MIFDEFVVWHMTMQINQMRQNWRNAQELKNMKLPSGAEEDKGYIRRQIAKDLLPEAV